MGIGQCTFSAKLSSTKLKVLKETKPLIKKSVLPSAALYNMSFGVLTEKPLTLISQEFLGRKVWNMSAPRF